MNAPVDNPTAAIERASPVAIRAPRGGEPFLAPVERPKSLIMRLVFFFSKRKFGKVMGPLTVFAARMPSSFGMFYGKVSTLDKKLQIPWDLVLILRGRVSSINGCLFCFDAANAFALENPRTEKQFDALGEDVSSSLFTEAERSALDYVTDLTQSKAVSGDTFAKLATHYTEREICDIVWIVASEHLYNLSNIGLNIGSDGMCDIVRRKRRA
ncbi:MAG: carboxymuconolactone decarboxylase family protein [Candidatus Dormiibacterota bacterium]